MKTAREGAMQSTQQTASGLMVLYAPVKYLYWMTIMMMIQIQKLHLQANSKPYTKSKIGDRMEDLESIASIAERTFPELVEELRIIMEEKYDRKASNNLGIYLSLDQCS